ncbi:retrovirus-related pol polyprotein from transposon TNT 1-94 [Tanacetum coccineum]
MILICTLGTDKPPIVDFLSKLAPAYSVTRKGHVQEKVEGYESFSGKDNVENVKKDIDQFDSIRKKHVQSKEHCASLIAQINAKSVENSDLNAQLQEKVFAIAVLKIELRKLKGKNVVDIAVSKPSATIAPGMFNLDIEPISHRLKNNMDSHEVYLKNTIENTNTLHGLVECARKQYPSEPLLESACMFTKHVQELLVYVSKTCPSLMKPCGKVVVVTPMNKDKKIRFVELVTSSSNIPKQTNSLKTKDSNKPLLTSIGVKNTTSASSSKPSGNTKKNRISRPISNAHVKHFVRNAKFESICVICNKSLFDANHDMCVIDYVNDVNVRSKSKSKINKMRKVWKPTGKVFNEIGYSWKPTGRTFTIVVNKCPLTRITSTKEVPLKETTITLVITQSPALKVYSRKPKASRSVVQIVLWYLDSGCSKYMTGNYSQLINFLSKFLGTIRFGNDHIAKASKTKSWLWHRRLSHLNFDYITSLAKHSLVRGLPKLKYQKDHLCSACALSKSKKHSHKPKVEDSIQEKLYCSLWIFAGQRGSSLYETFLSPKSYVVPNKDLAKEPVVSTGTPSSTIIDQDAPSTSTSQTTQETPTPFTPLGIEEADHNIEVAHMDNNPSFDNVFRPSFKKSFS